MKYVWLALLGLVVVVASVAATKKVTPSAIPNGMNGADARRRPQGYVIFDVT